MMDKVLQERLQVLLGERGNKAQAALRRGDIKVPTMQSSQATGGSISVEQYNQLQADVAQIQALLSSLATTR